MRKPAQRPRGLLAKLGLLSPWQWTLVAALVLRVLTWRPAIIDDDEAWFSVTGYSMHGLGDAFRSVIDNKPPGTAWFYWALARVVGPEQWPHLAQWARGAQTLLLLAGAWVFAYAVPGVAQKRRHTWPTQFAAVLLLSLGAAGPKLYAVTNESLMITATLFALAFAFLARQAGERLALRSRPGLPALAWALISGMTLAKVILVKQTGIFLVLPWVLALGAQPALLVSGFVGMFATLTASISIVGPHLFWQWAYVYPSSVLMQMRAQLFSEWQSGAVNLTVFAVMLLPLFWVAIRRIAQFAQRPARARSGEKLGVGSVAWAWLAASALAVIAGKGLFPHYFLVIVPPLAWMALSPSRPEPEAHARSWRWIAIPSALSALVAAWPAAGVFWGNDLPYYGELASHVQSLLASDRQARVFVWGGNVLPLAMTGLRSIEGFPNARFAVKPYATPASQAAFEAGFEDERPALLLDLHERGDNQFNVPISASPTLAALLARNYVAWADPALPWARFYLRKDLSVAPENGGFCQASRERAPSSALSGLPHAPRAIALLQKLGQELWPATPVRMARRWVVWDPYLRARFNAGWWSTACSQGGPSIAAPSQDADPELLADYTHNVEKFYLQHRGRQPFSDGLPLWWASLAVVEMQPVAIPRPKSDSF